MKQQITPDQWDEITRKQQKIFIDAVESFNPWFYRDTGEMVPPYPNIGQMIEFLGTGWITKIAEANDNDEIRYLRFFEVKENLCNYLWEAVKLKLKQHGSH